MRIWRLISAIGAVQLKTGLQILTYREELMENITWLIGEVNASGGEALALQCAQVEGMADEQPDQRTEQRIGSEQQRAGDQAQQFSVPAVHQRPC